MMHQLIARHLPIAGLVRIVEAHVHYPVGQLVWAPDCSRGNRRWLGYILQYGLSAQIVRFLGYAEKKWDILLPNDDQIIVFCAHCSLRALEIGPNTFCYGDAGGSEMAIGKTWIHTCERRTMTHDEVLARIEESRLDEQFSPKCTCR